MWTDHDQAQRPALRVAGVEHNAAEAAAECFACANSASYGGGMNVAARLVRPGGVPVGAIALSVPMTRGSRSKAMAELAPRVSETARSLWAKVF